METFKILKTMLLNFLIWLVPVLIILALSVILIMVLMMAAADIGSGGDDKDMFKKWPKGLIGSLGIAYLLAGIFIVFAYFYWSDIAFEEPIYLFGLALFCLIIGVLGIRYDYRRMKHKPTANAPLKFFVFPIIFALVLFGCNSTTSSEFQSPKISKEFKNGVLDKEYIYKNQKLKKIIFRDDGFYESCSIKLNPDEKVAEVRYERDDPSNKWHKKISIWEFTYENGQKKTATFSIDAQRFKRTITKISYEYPNDRTVVSIINELTEGNKENSRTLTFHLDEKGNPLKKEVDYVHNHTFKPDYYMEYIYDDAPSPAYLIDQIAPGYFIDPIGKNNVLKLTSYKKYGDAEPELKTVTYSCKYNADGLLSSYSSNRLNYTSTYQYLN